MDCYFEWYIYVVATHTHTHTLISLKLVHIQSLVLSNTAIASACL